MGFFSKIFRNDNDKFEKVKVDREVIDSFLYYANKSYPNEFLALLEGKIKEKTLYITGLIFLPGDTSGTGAVLQTGMLPPTMDSWGSIHSHPGPSAQPSGADLSTFSKLGVFHMIVCLPYSIETIKAYDKHGNPAPLNIGDYRHLFSDEELDDDDFFTDDDNLDDDDFFDDDLGKDDFSKNDMVPPIPNMNPNQIFINLDDIKDGGIINIEVDEHGNVKKVNNDKKRKK